MYVGEVAKIDIWRDDCVREVVGQNSTVEIE